MSPGGVGRNIAENLARLGTRTHLVAAIGPTARRPGARRDVRAGVARRAGTPSARATGTYTAVLDADGELVVAVADMAATDELDASAINGARATGRRRLAGRARRQPRHRDAGRGPRPRHAAGVRVVLEPVSVPKAAAAGTPGRHRPAACTRSRPTATSSPRSPAAARSTTATPLGRPPAPCTTAASSRLGPPRPARLGAVSAERGITRADRARRRSGRGRRRHRCRRRDARRLLPRACSTGTPGPGGAPRRTATLPPPSPSPAHTVRPDLTDRLDQRSSSMTDPSGTAGVAPTSATRRGRRGARRRAHRSSRWRARSSATACPTRRTSTMATEVEGIVREHGAVPATIAVLDGRPLHRPVARPARAARQRRRRHQGQRPRPARTSSRGGSTAPRRWRRRCGWPRWPASARS